MKIELKQIYNNQPYYEITSNGNTCYFIKAEGVDRVIKEAQARGEEIDTKKLKKTIDNITEDYNKIMSIIGGKNQNEKIKTKNKK